MRTGRFLNQPISMKGYNSRLTDTLTYFIQENLGGSGAIRSEEAEEYLREHMKMEGDLERQRQEKKEMQIAAVKERLEQRKKERMRKLKEKQELERAQVRFLSAKTRKKNINYSQMDRIQWRSQPDNLVPLCKFQFIIIIHFFRN